MGTTSSHRVALHVLIQMFIWIQIRAVARKVKNSNSIFMLLEPFLYFGCYMYGMRVNDENDITGDLPDQPPQKLRKHLTLKPLLEK
jgi:hypothetical protein